MIEIDKDTFEQEVEHCPGPVVVDFWGPHCAPCLALLPDVEQLAESYASKIKFCKVNVAANRHLCISLKVMGVPAFLFYKGGECTDRLTGDDVSLEAIKTKADALLA